MHSTPPSRWKICSPSALSTVLGIDLSGDRHRGAIDSAGADVRVRFSIAGSSCCCCAIDWSQDLVLASADCAVLRGGCFIVDGGQFTLSYAELSVSTGLAALIVAITPLWFLVLDSMLLGRHRIAGGGKAGLALGFVGLLVLFYPELTSTTALGRKELWASLSLIAGSFSWALGSVLSKSWQSGMDPFSSTGWQVTAAGAANFLFALLVGTFIRWCGPRVESAQSPTSIVCGSWIGYTAYIWLLKHVPTSKVSTYAYVNPVVAVFLGWLVLHERVNGFIVAGSAVVMLSVILVTSAKVKEKAAAKEIPEIGAFKPEWPLPEWMLKSRNLSISSRC